HEQRQRQETVRDRAAERRLTRALGVDVHELVIERDVGECVDAGLIDLEPVRDAEQLADALLELLPGDGLAARAHGPSPDCERAPGPGKVPARIAPQSRPRV